MITANSTLLQYLRLDQTHVINLSFDDYYFYPNTLINTKTKHIITNLKLNPKLPLSRQIKHPITIPPDLNGSLTVLTIKVNSTLVYLEWLFPIKHEITNTFIKLRKYETRAMIAHPLHLTNVIHDIATTDKYNLIFND